MADAIRIVEYFYITASNKPGEGARALNTLKAAGVNLLAFSGFPQSRRAQLDFIAADPAAFKQAAKQASGRWSVPSDAFSCRVPVAVMSASAYQGAQIRKEYSATGVECG